MWRFSSHFAKWSCLTPFLHLSHRAQLLGCRWEMPGLCFGKGPQSKVGLEAEGQPSSGLSWLLWFLSVASTMPLASPSLAPQADRALGDSQCPDYISCGF